MDGKYWFALAKCEENYYLLCNEKGQVNFRKTKKEMLEAFKIKYMKANPTSAILNNIQFEPSIINLFTKEIEEKLFDLKEGVKINHISSPLGSFYGLGCNRNKKNIEKLFDEGTKVSPP